MERYIQTLQDFMVMVRCYTYNHSAYITDALNGFTMQQTNFPFVIVLVDDASTDGEQEIIQEYIKTYFKGSLFHKETDYANITFTQHVSNKNCYIAAYLLKENHYSQKKKKNPYVDSWRDKCKYEALCEGDDYWIIPSKLQKQVAILENNKEYGMCFGKIRSYILSQNKYENKIFGSKVKSMKSLLLVNTIPTLTTMFRTELFLNYLKEKDIHVNNWLLGDYPIWLYMKYHSKIYFIDEIMGVYRILENSMSHSIRIEKKEQFINSVYDVRIFFAIKYNIINIKFIQNRRFYALMLNAISYNDKKRVEYWYNYVDKYNWKAFVKFWLFKMYMLFVSKLPKMAYCKKSK